MFTFVYLLWGVAERRIIICIIKWGEVCGEGRLRGPASSTRTSARPDVLRGARR